MWFEVICLLVVLAGIVFGYKRGILVQLGKFAGILGGIIFCNVFANSLAEKFYSEYDEPTDVLLVHVMAYVIIFIASYIVGSCFGSVFNKLTRKVHLGIIDKLAGAIFNVLEYLLALSIFFNVWVSLFPDSKIHEDMEGTKAFVFDFAPTILGSETVSEFFNSMQDVTDKLKGNSGEEETAEVKEDGTKEQEDKVEKETAEQKILKALKGKS